MLYLQLVLGLILYNRIDFHMNVDVAKNQPDYQRGGRGGVRYKEGADGKSVGCQTRSRVEAEPAKPQNAGTENHKRYVVRLDTTVNAAALADQPGSCNGCYTSIDVNNRAAGEVEST